MSYSKAIGLSTNKLYFHYISNMMLYWFLPSLHNKKQETNNEGG